MQSIHQYTTVAFFLLVSLFSCFANSSDTEFDRLKKQLKLASITPKEKVDLYNNLAERYSLREKDSLHHYINEAMQLSDRITYQEGKVNSNYILACHAFQIGEFEKGEVYLQTVLRLADSIGYAKGLADGYIAEGIKFLRLAQLDDALNSVNKSYATYEESNDTKGLIHFYNLLGNIYGRSGQNDNAIDSYESSLVYAKQAKDRTRIAIAYNNIASVLEGRQEYTKAIAYYSEGLKIAEEIGDKLLIAICSNNMGEIYLDLDDYEAAELNYNKFYASVKNEDNPTYTHTYHLNIGDLYYEREDYETSLRNYYESLKYAQASQDTVLIGITNDAIGKNLRKQGKAKEAIIYHEKALALFEQKNTGLELAVCKIHLAEVYKDLKQNRVALKYAKAAYEWAKKQKDAVSVRKSCSEVMSKLYAELDNYQQAHYYLLQYKTIDDSVKTTDVIRYARQSFLEKEERKELREKAMEEGRLLEAQKADIDKAKIEKRNQENLRTFGIMLIALIFLFVVWGLFRTRATNDLIKKQNEEISEKNAALKAQTKKLEHINKTKDKLFAIVSHDLRGPIGGLEQVLEMLVSGEMSREEFIELADDLKQNTSNVHHLLENLLQWSYSQMQESEMEIQSSVFSIKRVSENVCSTLVEAAKKKTITLECLLDPNLYIQADPNHVSLVIRNLVSNAIKFTNQGGKISVNSVIGKNGMVTFSIQDNGIGMTQEQLNKIRVGESTPRWGTNGEKGVGLGLAICQEMIIKNGGENWVESEVNKGSTFYFTLPLAKSPEQETKEKEETKDDNFSSAEPHHVSDPSA